MASHLSVIQIYKDLPKILIHLFVFVSITHANIVKRCWKWEAYFEYTGPVTTSWEANTNACMRKCEHTLYCHLINFNEAHRYSCSVTTEPDVEKFLTPNPDLTTVWRQPTDCLLGRCWQKHAGKGMHGFKNTPNEKTLYYCAQKCLYAKIGCLHFTYTHGARKPCWIDTHSRRTVDWVVTDGVDSYSVDKACWASSSDQIKRTSKAPVQDLPKCWYEMNNIRFPGIINAYEIEWSACIGKCEQTRHCIVISYQKGARWPCWYSNESIDLWVHEDELSYDSYALDADCMILPERTCWIKKKDFEYINVEVIAEAKSVITCMETCQNGNCSMITYKHGHKNPCFIGFERTATEPRGDAVENIDSYRVAPDCSGGTRPVQTTRSSTSSAAEPSGEMETDEDPGNETEPTIETDLTRETEPSRGVDPESDVPTEPDVPPEPRTPEGDISSVYDDEISPNETGKPVSPKSKATSKTFLSLYCCIFPLVLLAGSLLNMHALHQ